MVRPIDAQIHNRPGEPLGHQHTGGMQRPGFATRLESGAQRLQQTLRKMAAGLLESPCHLAWHGWIRQQISCRGAIAAD